MAKQKQKRKTGSRKSTQQHQRAVLMEMSDRERERSKRLTLVVAAILFVFGFSLYANTIGHDFVLDDQIVVTSNRFVLQGGMEGLKNIFSHGFLYGYNGQNHQSYRPIVLASLLVERQLFGTSPHVHHFFNVMMFAACSVAFFLLLQQLFRNTLTPIIVGASLFFVTHPIHTEAVANIKGRDEVLALLFLLLTLYTLCLSLSSKRRWMKPLSVFVFFIATITKETATTGIVLIPLTLYFFRDLPWKTILKTTVPYAVVLAIYTVLRFSILDRVIYEEDMLVINNAMMSVPDTSRRLATAVAILARYLGLLAFPHPLSFDYSYKQIPIIDWSHWQTIASIVIHLALGVFTVWCFRRRHLLGYAILFYGITLLLVSNLLTIIGATAAERFLFSPSIGFCLALAFVLAILFRQTSSESSPRLRNGFYAVVGIVAIAYSAKTVAQNRIWENEQTLYSEGVLVAPNSARVHRHYASFLHRDAKRFPNPELQKAGMRKAVEHFRRAVEILPEFGEAWIDLGTSYYELADYTHAMEAFRRGAELEPKNSRAKNNIGLIHYVQGNYQAAKQALEEALAIDPNNAYVMGNLAMAIEKLGDLERAYALYEKAVPQSPVHLDNMIALCEAMGKRDKAEFYRRGKALYQSAQAH